MANILKDKYKILPNKTYNLDFEFPLETIPDNLIKHFIRGFIDGDGCFESEGNIFTPSIVGTSKNWLIQVGDIINLHTKLTYKIYEKVGKTCTYYTLRWSANNKNKLEKIKLLFEFLYNDSNIYLTRKRNKIESYLKYRAN